MKIHIVKRGETLAKIAKKFNLSLEKLKEMNPQIKDEDVLIPGMKVKVPSAGVPLKSKKAVTVAGKKSPVASVTDPSSLNQPTDMEPPQMNQMLGEQVGPYSSSNMPIMPQPNQMVSPHMMHPNQMPMPPMQFTPSGPYGTMGPTYTNPHAGQSYTMNPYGVNPCTMSPSMMNPNVTHPYGMYPADMHPAAAHGAMPPYAGQFPYGTGTAPFMGYYGAPGIPLGREEANNKAARADFESFERNLYYDSTDVTQEQSVIDFQDAAPYGFHNFFNPYVMPAVPFPQAPYMYPVNTPMYQMPDQPWEFEEDSQPGKTKE